MKKNLLAMLLAVVMTTAVVFIAAPNANADDVADFTADAENKEYTANADCTVDLNGQTGVVINAEGYKVTLVDTANAKGAVDGSNAGSATVKGTVADWVQYDGYKYLAVKNEDNTYSAHPFNITIDKYGVNTHYSAVSIRVTVIANDVVAKLIDAGEFGLHKTAGTEGAVKEYFPHWKAFAGDDGEIAVNGIRAYYYLDGSFAKNVLTNDLFATVGAYIKIGDLTIESFQTLTIKPLDILTTLNNTAASFGVEQKAKVVEMASDNYLKDYCCNFCGHNIESVVTDPTCTEGGYTTNTYLCKCGQAAYTDNETAATGHTHIVRPTCTTAGSITSKCQNCDYTNPTIIDLTQAALTHNTLIAVDCRVEQVSKDLDNDGTKQSTNRTYFITNYGSDKITPFKFLNFGNDNTCEVTFYIFNGTTDTLTNINLSYGGYGMYAYANAEDAATNTCIPGTTAELNLAPNAGMTVTLTIPKACYISNSKTSLTAGSSDSLGELVPYRDLGLRINLSANTEAASNKIYVSCLSDSVVTESLALTQRWGKTASTTWLRAGTTYNTAANKALTAAFNSYYVSGYTCIHEATKIG